MTVRKLSVEATIKRYTNENGFSWGINTVMKSLAPDASYDLTSAGLTAFIPLATLTKVSSIRILFNSVSND